MSKFVSNFKLKERTDTKENRNIGSFNSLYTTKKRKSEMDSFSRLIGKRFSSKLVVK